MRLPQSAPKLRAVLPRAKLATAPIPIPLPLAMSHPPPLLQVLGVYRFVVTGELLRRQAALLYGSTLEPEEEAEVLEDCREQIGAAVLVEVLVQGAGPDFALAQVGQVDPELPEENWQVPWAPAYLSADGAQLLSRRQAPEPLPSSFRLAFTCHWWLPSSPLLTPYGALPCPPPQPPSPALARLLPYEPRA